MCLNIIVGVTYSGCTPSSRKCVSETVLPHNDVVKSYWWRTRGLALQGGWSPLISASSESPVRTRPSLVLFYAADFSSLFTYLTVGSEGFPPSRVRGVSREHRPG